MLKVFRGAWGMTEVAEVCSRSILGDIRLI
jgi:hypothetical protein